MGKNDIQIEELLFTDEPIVINRKLAKCLGLKEAVIFQQIHYWLKHNEKTKQNFREGKYWTYNTIKKWHEDEFDFLSIRTVERTLQKLEKDGLLISKTFNKMKGDKTKWYTIDYKKLLEVCKKSLSNKEILSSKRSESGKKGAIAKKNKNENTIQPIWQNGGAYNQIGNTIQPNWQNGVANLAEPIPETTTKTSTKITSSSSILKNEFENNICELKKTTNIKFDDYVKKYNGEFILAIIEYCTEINIRSFAGFKKVIDSYIGKNILNRKDLFKDIENYRNEKKKNKDNNKNNSKFKLDKFNDFEQRQYDFEDLEEKLLKPLSKHEGELDSEELKRKILSTKNKTSFFDD
ncbi:hypothetical protein [Clostridium botulinum]|uniref:hypothetical protein n=1 Tax=Clostridium botulinum TaxID=1491 RepID=UPI0007734BA5|nr:hypothetical protein [Clostridium botulinum]